MSGIDSNWRARRTSNGERATCDGSSGCFERLHDRQVQVHHRKYAGERTGRVCVSYGGRAGAWNDKKRICIQLFSRFFLVWQKKEERYKNLGYPRGWEKTGVSLSSFFPFMARWLGKQKSSDTFYFPTQPASERNIYSLPARAVAEARASGGIILSNLFLCSVSVLLFDSLSLSLSLYLSSSSSFFLLHRGFY